MYWFKLNPQTVVAFITGALISVCFVGCRPDTKGRGGLKYFNVKAFFAAETARLQKNNEPVFKTISYNGGTESKTVKIKNWKQELDFFQSSDINKPAWKNSYAVANYADEIIYRAKDPDLKMREMIVKSENHVVKYIFIFNSAKNILYQTTEKLSYFPDSAYIIEKAQRVALLGASVYKVKGVFKR